MRAIIKFPTVVRAVACGSLILLVAFVFISLAPTSSMAWPSGGHSRGTNTGLDMFWWTDFADGMPGSWDLRWISRDRATPIYPELTQEHLWYNPEEDPGDPEDLWAEQNWKWVKLGSYMFDEYDNTLHHFWHVDDGMADLPGGFAGVDNAVETIMPLWVQTLQAWQDGQLGKAYTKLGYVLHLIEDMGQPAHTNDDMHPSDDCLEDWLHEDGSDYQWDSHFQWFMTDPSEPVCFGCAVQLDQRILDVPTDNLAILIDMINADPAWEGLPELLTDDDWDILRDPDSIINQQQLFYILYYVNQTGNYFASDDEPGDAYDPIGWLDGYPGFPGNEFHLNCDPNQTISVHDSFGLFDNDSCDCDCDGDLSLITRFAYGTAYRAIPAVINLFRRTVDAVPPATTIEMTRLDGLPVAEWNNSPVVVRLIDPVDFGNPGFRASGVFRAFGLHNGLAPTGYDGTLPPGGYVPSWVIDWDGVHTIESLTTDWIGNVEDQEATVKFDGRPPEIEFVGLKPIYLTSEDFVADWISTDVTSGVDSEIAYLDGILVDKGQVIDLALMAGHHRLEVWAADRATNMAYALHEFETVIDAEGWGRPIHLNNKGKGKAMFTAVEFPAPYDVALIEDSTCTLVVNGTVLAADRMTGVGDHDANGIPDRMLRFNREEFIAAIGGQVDDVPVEIWGALLPDGTPRFVADVTIPVFRPGRYGMQRRMLR